SSAAPLTKIFTLSLHDALPIYDAFVDSSHVADRVNEPAFDDMDLTKHETTVKASSQTMAMIAEHQLLLTTLPVAPKPLEIPERHALNFFIKSTDSQLRSEEHTSEL